MSWLRSILSLPQPVRTVYLGLFGTLPVAMAVVLLVEAAWPFAVPGTFLLLLGIVLVSDLRGNAAAVARMLQTQRPLGVDYSRSRLATTGYARTFGAVALVTGVGFLVFAATSS